MTSSTQVESIDHSEHHSVEEDFCENERETLRCLQFRRKTPGEDDWYHCFGFRVHRHGGPHSEIVVKRPVGDGLEMIVFKEKHFSKVWNYLTGAMEKFRIRKGTKKILKMNVQYSALV